MKLLRKRLKRRENQQIAGEITVMPESTDDLWHLRYVIEPGDLVYSSTFRRVEESTDKIRPDKTEKKRVRLGIRVEGVEFHKFSHRLRVKGVIETGLDAGYYHTFNIEPEIELSIIKSNWRTHQLERLREAERASNKAPIIILTIESGEAVAGIVRQYGVDELFSIRYGSGKGSGDSTMKEFFNDVLNQLQQAYYSNACDALIIAGPGFIKNEFYEFMREKAPELHKRAVIEQASSTGISGFMEVLKRGAVARLRAVERLAREVKLLANLMAEISRDEGGLAVYGEAEVRKAMQYGAVERLLVCDEMLMAEGSEEIEDLLRGVERMGGNIVVFSTEFEPGKRLKALGGIAAMLRFKLR